MAVQVWIGEKPEHPQERRAIVALASSLERLDGLYLILANFSVGGRNIDLVVIKQDGIFIIELKYCDGKVFGDVNGPWYVEGSNGEQKRLNPGRKNPYNQVISYYYSLVNFLNDNRPRFLSAQKSASVDFRTCRRLVVIAPLVQEGSHVETDWKVDFKGLDELPSYLVTERSSEISLTEEEMLAIPELLHCTRWSEINVLLSSELTRMEPPAGDERAAPVGAPSEPPATPVAARPLQRFGGWLTKTWAGRAAVVALCAGIVTTLLVLRPTPAPQADQPAPMVASTSLPAGGADAALVPEARPCTWSGFQPVGRRRGSQPDTWETVGIDGVARDLTPEVVVTLEEVAFCEGRIAITWSVRNNTDDMTVALPLSNDNIIVRDSLGNSYPLAQEQSRPFEVRAEPRSKSQGTAIIAQPVNLNAPTLVIQIRRLPFGEATWLVPIQGL